MFNLFDSLSLLSDESLWNIFIKGCNVLVTRKQAGDMRENALNSQVQRIVLEIIDMRKESNCRVYRVIPIVRMNRHHRARIAREGLPQTLWLEKPERKD